MVIWAWLGAILIGLSLGLLGSGGSILTVPVLVYLVGQDEKVAFAGSLAIVGLISLVSAFAYARKDMVDWRSAMFLACQAWLAPCLVPIWRVIFLPGCKCCFSQLYCWLRHGSCFVRSI